MASNCGQQIENAIQTHKLTQHFFEVSRQKEKGKQTNKEREREREREMDRRTNI